MRVLPKLVLCAALAMMVLTLEGCGGTVKKIKDDIIGAICSAQVQQAIKDLKTEADKALTKACNALESSDISPIQCKQNGEAELETEAQQEQQEMNQNCTAKWNERLKTPTGIIVGAAEFVQKFIKDSEAKLQEYKSRLLAIAERYMKGTEVCNGIKDRDECNAKACCNYIGVDVFSPCESKVGDDLCVGETTEAQKLFAASGAVVAPKGAQTQSLVGFGVLAMLVSGAAISGIRMVRARASAADSGGDFDTAEPLHESEDIE